VASVRLPAILAREAGGRSRFETGAATAREALAALPVADLLIDERGELRPLVNVYVDGSDARGRLDDPLSASADVRVVAAVAGGSHRDRPADAVCSGR
jgi:hypothetical protein